MFEKFRDYMYYLLPSPFKIIKKKLNQWYIWCRILGVWFDEVKEDLMRARDETSIATCSDILLKYYADERGLVQYSGETNDTFRTRIAMADDVEANGGTRDSLILAVKSLGYDKVEHIWCPVEDGDFERWAEFIIEVTAQDDAEFAVPHEILKNEVRKTKESTSLDNYRYRNELHAGFSICTVTTVRNIITIGDMA